MQTKNIVFLAAQGVLLSLFTHQQIILTTDASNQPVFLLEFFACQGCLRNTQPLYS